MNIFDTFIEYCFSGNIDRINCINKMSLKDYNLDNMLVTTCCKGHYDTVKYLIGLYKIGNPKDTTYYNITDVNNYDMINIHSYNKYGFGWACYKGHYMIVKYFVELYKIGNLDYNMINVHSNDEEGLKWAHEQGHNMIIKYLMTLYKKYKKYEPINNYLIIFRKFNKFMI